MKALRVLAVLILILSASGGAAETPSVPLPSGAYQFVHRDAEFPDFPGFPVTVTIYGDKFEISGRKPGYPDTMCVLDGGTLMWNKNVGKWVLGHDESDKLATEAGGCQDDGPDTIDFASKSIWTCSDGATLASHSKLCSVTR